MKKWMKLLCLVLVVTVLSGCSYIAGQIAQQLQDEQSQRLPVPSKPSDNAEGDIEDYSKLQELLDLIDERFIDEYDRKAVEDAAAAAIVEALGDRWSYYIPKDQYAAYLENKNNSYVASVGELFTRGLLEKQPAVANFELTQALKQAADELDYKSHIGVVHCKDSFYGQHNPQRMPVSYELENKWEAWIKAGVLCSEMETASLFTVASVLNMKAAAVLLVVWNQEKEKRGMAQETSFDVDKQIIVAIRAISNIIKGR